MRICMLLHKSVEHDSRVRREAKALAGAGHEVTVVHLAAEEGPLDGFERISAEPPRRLRRLPLAAHRLAMMVTFVAAVRRCRPDAVHAHDAAMLAPGFVAARLTRAALVYDSHELATGVVYRGRAWAGLVWVLERMIVRRCDAIVTVSDGIAARLQRLYSLPARPTVVRNLCALPAANGHVDLKSLLGIGPGVPVVLHQGAAAGGRGCETLVEAMAEVPVAHLLFLGDNDPGYTDRLTELAGRAGLSERVHFLPSVPLEQLLAFTRTADVGVALLEGTCENHRLALPNKVFEYVSAEVPVVASALPELERLVGQFGIGTTVESSDAGDVARGIRGIIASPPARRRLAEARQLLDWSRESERLISLYRGLTPV